MASISKLSVKGVRSYDPYNESVIKFEPPLTIIVGQNGAGKTTIIESLKYATTGVFPPNGKNGTGFVHDPKLVKKMEVEATIKLKFQSVKKEKMECNRGMVVTTKGASSSMKTNQNILTNYSDPSGETTRTGLKTKEMDEQMLNLLGTNKSILDNVIFCHQEESNWPLSESSILKKKFDEIFASFKFSKCLEELKEIKKNSKAEADVLEATLKALHYKDQRSKEVSQKLNDRKKEIQNANTSITEKRKEIDARNDAVDKINENLILMRSALNAKLMSQRERETLSQELRDNVNGLTEANLTLEKLKSMNEENQSIMLNKDAQRQSLNLECESIKDQIALKQSKLRDSITKHAKLYSERELIETKLKEGYRFIENAQCVLSESISGSDSEYESDSEDEEEEETDLNDFEKAREKVKRRIESKLDKLTSKLQSQKGKGKATESKLKDEEINLKNRRFLIESKISELTNLLSECSVNRGRLCKRRESSNESSPDLSGLGASIQSEEVKLEEAKVTLKNEDIDSQIATKRALCNEVELKLHQKGEANNSNESFGNSEMVRKVKENELNQVKNELQSLIESKKTRFLRFFGTVPSPDSCVELVRVEIDLYAGVLQENKAKIAQYESELIHLVQLNKESQAQLHALHNRFSELNIKVGVSTGNRLFEDVYNEAQTLLIKAFVEKKTFQFKTHLLDELLGSNKQAALDKLRSCKSCCEQYGSKTIFDTLEDLIVVQHNKDLAFAELDSKITTAKNSCKSLLDLAPDWGALDRIKSQKIDLEKKLQISDSDKSKIEEGKADLESMCSDLDIKLKGLKQLLIVSNDISNLAKQVQKLGLELETLPPPAALEEDETTETYKDLAQKHKNLGHQIRVLESNRNRHEAKIKQHENEINRLKSLKFKALEERQGLVEIESQLRDIRAKENKAATELQDLKASLAPVKATLENKTSELTGIVATREATELQIQSRVTELRDLKLQLTNLEADLSKFDVQALDSQLALASSSIATTEAEIAELQNAQEDVSCTVEELQQQSMASSSILEHVRQALKYHRILQQIHKVDLEIIARQEYVDSFGFHEEEIQAKLMEATQTIKGLQSECDKLEGNVQSWQKEVASWNEELETKFPNIHREYLTKLYETELCKAAVEDATHYAKALEKSIMRYHKEKMDEINDIVQDLWMNTYSGEDIDTVRIVSDLENEKNRSSFNYRTVMVKGTSELDMRGRCSAGQKVLASIIIRLALAEAFGGNCGILALDEPTTNLDKENVAKLAEALSGVIAARRSQNNFQLLIITHDKNFTNLLCRDKYTDFYYVVTKGENNYSEITRQSITNLG